MDIYDHTFITKEGRVYQYRCNDPYAVSYYFSEKDGWAYFNDSSTEAVIEITPGTTLEDLARILSQKLNIDKQVRERLQKMIEEGKLQPTISFTKKIEPMTKDEVRAMFANIRK